MQPWVDFLCSAASGMAKNILQAPRGQTSYESLSTLLEPYYIGLNSYYGCIRNSLGASQFQRNGSKPRLALLGPAQHLSAGYVLQQSMANLERSFLFRVYLTPSLSLFVSPCVYMYIHVCELAFPWVKETTDRKIVRKQPRTLGLYCSFIREPG